MTQTFIGTFGVSHATKSKVYQPITAEDLDEAWSLMGKKHGKEWCAVYRLPDYKLLQDDGLFKGHQPLESIGGMQI